MTMRLAIGIATLKVGDAADAFLTFVRSALAVVQKVLWWIILLAPIATVGLLGNAVASYGWDALGSLGTFTLANRSVPSSGSRTVTARLSESPEM